MPYQLAEFPELAALELLDAALAVARNALLAMHPQVENEHFMREPPAPTVLACLADSIVAQADALQRALTRYRDFAHALMFGNMENTPAPSSSQDDLPF